MNFSKNNPIAIVDSGIGGVSVLKQLIAKFGGGNYIYYADNLYMPYGNKSKIEINKRVDYIINLLKTKYKVESVIIACNTASTSIDSSKYKNVYTMQFNKKYTYYATNLTKNNLKNIRVIADTNLPNLIEKYIFNKSTLEKLIKQRINTHQLKTYKEIVLGCTHYELISNTFKKFAKNTNFINNSSFVLKDINMEEQTELNIHLLTSKNDNKFNEKFYKLLNWPLLFS